jgi:hypothetical protein
VTSREYDVDADGPVENDPRPPEYAGLFEGAVPDRLDGFPWRQGAKYGAGAFLAGYLLFVALYVVGVVQVTGGLLDQLKRVAFLFYGAHNVAVVGNTAPGAITVRY